MAGNSSNGSRAEGTAANQRLMRERHMFSLLLQSNPNYFGNALSSTLPARTVVSCNTYYEELCCLGYSPKERLLAAVITLRQPRGYGTGTRISSAPEYVRFYLSFDGGRCWVDQGCASVDAHNVAESRDRQLAVSLELPEGAESHAETTARVRAVLAWNAEPPADAPDWKPVFGNVLETDIGLSARSAEPAGAGVEEADERLCGIGLAAHDGALVAVVHVQGQELSAGYHHVTFWADIDSSGAFETHLGTVDMPLSALGAGVPGGLDYALRLPVDLEAYRQDCAEVSRTLPVRAILSRSKSGSRSKFRCVPPEKGCANACLTISPRVNGVAGKIALVGGMSAYTLESGEITLAGMRPTTGGYQIQGVPLLRHSYMLEISNDGRNWEPLLQELTVRDAQGAVHRNKPDPETGLFEYLPFEKNVAGVLACLPGVGVGKWRLRLRNWFGGMPLPECDEVIVRMDDSDSRIQEQEFPRHAGAAGPVKGMCWERGLLSA